MNNSHPDAFFLSQPNTRDQDFCQLGTRKQILLVCLSASLFPFKETKIKCCQLVATHYNASKSSQCIFLQQILGRFLGKGQCITH